MERNMYLDKEKAVKAFMGTGEKNAAGEDLVTFLEKYDPHKYQNPCNTVDMAVFAYNESEKKVTKVLLIQRGKPPKHRMVGAAGRICGVQGKSRNGGSKRITGRNRN
ncbi:MAG: hypothetical protein ACLU70_08660 [Lachnospira sp.]